MIDQRPIKKKLSFREEVCIGCRLCEIHCLVEHSRSREKIKAFKRETPRAVARIRVEEKGPLSFTVKCYHCDEPLCVYACLTGALEKDPITGRVEVKAEKCIGCWTCIMACPYAAISRDASRGIAAKCDLCPHLALPACVAHCPNEALTIREVTE